MAPQVSQTPAGVRPPTVAELVDRLSRFDGPPEVFLVNLLAVQCHLAGAETGAILRTAGPKAQPEILALYPPLTQGAAVPPWAGQAAESIGEVIGSGATMVRPVFSADDLYGAEAKQLLILVPLRGGQGVRGVAAFVAANRGRAATEQARERLEISSSLLSLYEMRLTLQQRQADFQRLRTAMEVLSAINEQPRIAGAAMAMCNEVASRWRADRVSLGFLKGRYVHLKATSHTEKFSRKMKLVQDIEAAQEECLDQDIEVVFPVSQESTYVSRAAGELSRQHGPSAIVSLPLRRAGQVTGVITVERSNEHVFTGEDIESLRLTCELATARMVSLYEMDRWFGARAVAGARKGLSTLVGAKHTWIKVVAILAFAAIAFLVFAKGRYRVQSPFTVQAVERRLISAPFDGVLGKVNVRPGDTVEVDQTLAEMDTKELGLQLEVKSHEYGITNAERTAAESESKDADVAKYTEQLKQIQADIDLLQYRIDQAVLKSPIKGKLLQGDLVQQIGMTVQTGKVLFEVGPLEKLRAELRIKEDQIGDVAAAMRERPGKVEGELATEGFPGDKIHFTVETIIPVAEVKDQKNIFRVRVVLDDKKLESGPPPSWLVPGVEGVAKVDIEKRRYAWIWTRQLVNWVRMRLWW
jgi:biotin carboxyl carrier protein